MKEGIPEEVSIEVAERDHTFVPEEKQERFDALSDRAEGAILNAERDWNNADEFNELAQKRLISAGITGGLAITGGVIAGPLGATIPGIATVAQLGMSAAYKGGSVLLEKRAELNEERAEDAFNQTREIVSDELVRTGATVEDGKITVTEEQIEMARKEMEDNLAQRSKME